MNRRHFLSLCGAAAASLVIPGMAEEKSAGALQVASLPGVPETEAEILLRKQRRLADLMRTCAGRQKLAVLLTPGVLRRLDRRRVAKCYRSGTSLDMLPGYIARNKVYTFKADFPLSIVRENRFDLMSDKFMEAMKALLVKEAAIHEIARKKGHMVVPLPMQVVSVDNPAQRTVGFHLKQQYAVLRNPRPA